MTGPEHYKLAEGYLNDGDNGPGTEILLQRAQVHATLALAAATALTGTMAKSVSWDLELDEWGKVASDQWPTG